MGNLFEKEKSTKIEFVLKESDKEAIKKMASDRGQNITDFIKTLINKEYAGKHKDGNNEYMLDMILSLLKVHKATIEEGNLELIKKSIDTIETKLRDKFVKVSTKG